MGGVDDVKVVAPYGRGFGVCWLLGGFLAGFWSAWRLLAVLLGLWPFLELLVVY